MGGSNGVGVQGLQAISAFLAAGMRFNIEKPGCEFFSRGELLDQYVFKKATHFKSF